MKRLLSILILPLLFWGCKKVYDAPIPDFSNWAEYNNAAATPLNASARNAMEAVYSIDDGADVFGALAAIKWSFVRKGTDTTFHVSGFFGKDIAYFICEGRKVNGNILLNGYWRKMASTATGIMRLTISAANGATNLLAANPVVTTGSITMEGVFGAGDAEPTTAIRLSNLRALNKSPNNFHILAHRSGGRTSDLLPASENSVEMILKTPEFGSTGIEIDVRYTRDGIPILYHDNSLNLRLIQKSGLLGAIENYSYAQLSAFVRLIHGEKIPTLREALDAVVYQTQLSFVWLDTKFIGSIDSVRAIQKEYLLKAAAIGRTIQIVIGLPGRDQFDQFLKLPDYAITPSLCELTLDDFQTCKASIWAPRFTEGVQNDLVAQVHAQGKMAFVWTLDVPEFMEQFIRDGHFDGILSNFPTLVAYNYYVRP
jgi:glycerophosphoryl diester phosphodiesterase